MERDNDIVLQQRDRYRSALGKAEQRIAELERERAEACAYTDEILDVIAKESASVGVTHEDSPNDDGYLKTPRGRVEGMARVIRAARAEAKQARRKALDDALCELGVLVDVDSERDRGYNQGMREAMRRIHALAAHEQEDGHERKV